jgi:hypothetical protein
MLEDGAEERSVHEVEREPCGRSSSSETAEEAAVGVLRSEKPP